MQQILLLFQIVENVGNIYYIKVFNLFSFNYITKNDIKTKFENDISDHFTLLKFFNIYLL
jgi:hypothetical protein